MYLSIKSSLTCWVAFTQLQKYLLKLREYESQLLVHCSLITQSEAKVTRRRRTPIPKKVSQDIKEQNENVKIVQQDLNLAFMIPRKPMNTVRELRPTIPQTTKLLIWLIQSVSSERSNPGELIRFHTCEFLSLVERQIVTPAVSMVSTLKQTMDTETQRIGKHGMQKQNIGIQI